MGNTLTPIAVDLEKVRGLIGSKNGELYEHLAAKHAEEFKDIDAIDDDDDEDEDDGEIINLGETGQNLGQFLQNAILGLLRGKPPSGTLRVELGENDPFVNGLAEKAEEIKERPKSEFPDAPWEEGDDDDESDEEQDQAPNANPRASTQDTLRHMIMGEEYDQRVGFKYGYALEAICAHFGEHLDDEEWWAPGSIQAWKWLKRIDSELGAAGVSEKTFRVKDHLMGRGTPIPIPDIDDFPSIAYMTLSEIKQAHKELASANVDAIGDESIRTSLGQVQQWFQACIDSKRDLVCFYY